MKSPKLLFALFVLLAAGACDTAGTPVDPNGRNGVLDNNPLDILTNVLGSMGQNDIDNNDQDDPPDVNGGQDDTDNGSDDQVDPDPDPDPDEDDDPPVVVNPEIPDEAFTDGTGIPLVFNFGSNTLTLNDRSITQSLIADGNSLPVAHSKTIKLGDNRIPATYGRYGNIIRWRIDSNTYIDMKYTTDSRGWIECEMVGSQGNLDAILGVGDVELPWLFALFTSETSLNRVSNAQALHLGGDWFAGLMPINKETKCHVSGDQGISNGLIVLSSDTLPTATTYVRNQHFAFFVCRRSELLSKLDTIEAAYNLPRMARVKMRPENNYDTLMLYGHGGDRPTPQQIINLCNDMGFKNVLLTAGFWQDPMAADVPFKPWGWNNPNATLSVNNVTQGWSTALFIEALQAGGLHVGIHVFAHFFPLTGYYKTHYPNWMQDEITSDSKLEGMCTFTFDGNPLPEIAADDLFSRVSAIGAEWVYFDGQGLMSSDGYYATQWYRESRLVDRFYRNAVNYPIIKSQSAVTDTRFDSAIGQFDVWRHNFQATLDTDVASASSIRNTMEVDIGWLPTKIHDWNMPNAEDWATLAEWQAMCAAALAADAPMTVLTSYENLVNNPAPVIPLIRDTITARTSN